MKNYSYGDKAWYLVNGKVMIPCVITKNYKISVGVFMPWNPLDEVRHEDMKDLKTINLHIIKRLIVERKTEMPIDKLFLERQDEFKDIE